MTSYGAGMDRCDWTRLRSCFTDRIELDLSSWSGHPATTLDADIFVANAREGMSGFDATEHQITDHAIIRDGERALCTANLVAHHFFANTKEEGLCTLGGYYSNMFVREQSRWKIAALKLTVTWSMGNRHVFELARQKWIAGGR
jgi:hypothetical protein